MLSITKLQNLKAIHNTYEYGDKDGEDVINHKTTKFESNSQQSEATNLTFIRCYQSQNYKIWKQFTTCFHCCKIIRVMLSITKLQNLKAIHNYIVLDAGKVVDVINHKTTKFESNSQHISTEATKMKRCYQSQNYKIWKQFTTDVLFWTFFKRLLSIIKLQNLKAIHNGFRFIIALALLLSITKFESNSQQPFRSYLLLSVVINHKITKFESNSQPFS